VSDPQPQLDRHFQAVGGEAGVRKIVDRFYDLMDTLPEAAGIRAIHPPSLDESRDKLTWFLVGWLGGPPRYVDRFGQPRLRARHLRVAIGDAERDAWMLCMRRAMEDLVPDRLLVETLCGQLSRVADHMRNQGTP
jgi:hemoglobin